MFTLFIQIPANISLEFVNLLYERIKSIDKKYFKDVIGEDYIFWSSGIIALDGGTGTGKTSFCIQTLGEYAKKNGKRILYLCNRQKLVVDIVRQVSDMEYNDVFLVYTYQCMQSYLASGKAIPKADYIIADECHYFYSDSFNGYTDMAFDYLINESKHSVLIMISATAKLLFGKLEDEQLLTPQNHYSIAPDYNNVNNLIFYRRNDISSIINSILENEQNTKIAVFLNSATRMQEMYDLYKDVGTFFASSCTDNPFLKRICNPNAIKEETFESRILFSTAAADNGINLNDCQIKHVISELIDIDGLIQSLGRKRFLSESDTCNFYVRDYSPREIQCFINMNKANVIAGREYVKNPRQFIKDNSTDRNIYRKYSIFYPGYRGIDQYDIMINKMQYQKCIIDDANYSRMLYEGYADTVLSFIGTELASKADFYDAHGNEKNSFISYLKTIEGKKLFADDRHEIQKRISTLGCKVRYIGINTFNGILKDIFPDYKCRFENKNPISQRYYSEKRKYLDSGEKNPNYDKRFWILH